MKDVYKKLDSVLDSFEDDLIERCEYVPHKYDIEDKLSADNLFKIQKNGNLDKANSIDDNDNRLILDLSYLYGIDFKGLVEKETGIKRKYSGFFWYPCDAFWAAESNKSFFRYQDPDTKEIITDWDKKGWQYRKFNVSRSKSYWHCVGSKTNRISIGLRLDK